MIELISNNFCNNFDKIDFSKLKNRRILLTGCTGLIGIHLLATLQSIRESHNIQIYCLVSKKPKHDDIFNNLFNGCFVVEGDLTKNTSIDYLLNIFSENQSGVDYIIHAAGYGQPKKFMNNKIDTILLNTNTIINLFKLLEPGGTFLYCSTSEIYSGIEDENITEERIGTTSPNHPRSCYIESKRCGEAILQAFLENGYNVKIARISLAYGPGTKKNDDRVLNNFVQKAIQKNSIDMLDSGKSIRTYCYVSDTVEILFNILLFGKSVVYNVSGESKVFIYELANLIGKKINCPVNIPKDNFNEMVGNPKLVNLSLDKYFREFGNKKFISLDGGLNNVIAWQKELYKN